MKLSACRRLELSPLTGTWYRAIRQEFWQTRLSARHTTTLSGRFNAGSVENPSFQILYLAQNHQLALFEVRALLGNPKTPIPDPQGTWITLNLNVVLQAVVDLTLSRERKLIGTTAQELTGSWDLCENSIESPTQLLGDALFRLHRLEGFLVPTAVSGISGKNLVVFPQKLLPESRIEFRNSITRRVERLKS